MVKKAKPAGRRRSGRNATSESPATADGSPPADSQPPSKRNTPANQSQEEEPQPAKKVRGRPRKTAATPLPAPTAQKKSRTTKETDDEEEEVINGGCGRRNRPISFRETDDDDDDDSVLVSSETDDEMEIVESEEVEFIDETVYNPPPEALVPRTTLIPIGNSGAQIEVSATAIGHIAAAYAILRAFSWQLRLSPFPFADFCAAMTMTQPTLLMDEIHVCVLRALAIDEIPEERSERKLDLALLDHISWPCFVWEMLRVTEDPLAKHEWAQRAGAGNKKPSTLPGENVDKTNEDVDAAPMETDNTTAAALEVLASIPSLAAVVGTPAKKKAFEPVNIAEMDKALEESKALAALASAQGDKDAVLPSVEEEKEEQNPAVENASKEKKKEEKALPLDVFTPDAAPLPLPRQSEYYSLSVEIKSAILSRLCDHLLDCTTIRAEIDRREEEGEFVAGQGGQGGAFPIMSEKDREKAAARAAKKQLADANTDACVLCGIGGILVCCDKCPAAYHVRCMGEKGEPKDEVWLCPECSVGGRGETAGLRIPVGARNKWKQPMHLLNGAVIRTELPAVQSRGRHAVELTDNAAAAYFVGEAAEEQLAEAHKVRNADEVPLASSFTMVEDPPKFPLPESGPESYINKYRNGWSASVTAIRVAVEESKKRKGKTANSIPTGTCGRLPLSEMPEPMPLSRFQWTLMQGRQGYGKINVRCGKCQTCLRPRMRKGCLNPISKSVVTTTVMAPQNDDGGAQSTVTTTTTTLSDTAKLSYLIAYVARVEREFWSLIEGPWASEPGGGMQYRANWAVALRHTSAPADLVQTCLELESLIRPAVFNKDWYGEDPAAGITTGAAASQPGSRTISRVGSMADFAGASGGQQMPDGSSEDGKGGKHNRGGPDPYDLKFEKPIFAEWEMDRSHHSAHVSNVNRLPISLLRKAARQSGRKPIPGIKYRKQKWTLTSPRQQWIAEMEAVQTCSQLALALRNLDAALNWDAAIKPKNITPEHKLANMFVREKRPASDGTLGYEYLIETRVPGAAEAAAFAEQQQKFAAALLQQRYALQQAQAMSLQQQLLAQQQQQQQQQLMASAAAAAAQAPAPGRLGSLNQWPASLPSGSRGLGTLSGVPSTAPTQSAAAVAGLGVSISNPPQQQQTAELPPLPPRPSTQPSPPAAVKEEGGGSAPAQPMDVDTKPSPPTAVAPPQPIQQQSTPPVAPASLFPGMPLGLVPSAAPAMQMGIAPGLSIPVGGQPSPFNAAAAMLSRLPMMAAAPVLVQPAAPQPKKPEPKKPIPLEKLDGDGKVIRKMVDGIIKHYIEREEEEKLMNMPAAMAAKMRSRHSNAGASSGDLKKLDSEKEKNTKEESEKKAAVVQLPPGIPPALAPFLGSLGMLPRAQVNALPPPEWKHERDLPLWFVKQYEEKVRREAGNLAARELQAAARRGGGFDATARKLAQQAAAAAADACGICYSAQGDNAELDGLWIACDACNRWFHGACVALTQEDVDAMGENDHWDCPGCSNARRKAERAARREGKPLPASFTPGAGGSEADAKGKGRPLKPFYERADYKAGEAKMLEKIRRGEIPGYTTKKRGRKSGVQFSEEELAARREKIKKKKEEEALLAAAPPPEIHCPVCQFPDYGRLLVECDTCKRWFHYECTGTAVEEVEAAVAENKDIHCAECQGKRVRPPTQAAIDASILAAAERERGALGGPSKKGRPAGSVDVSDYITFTSANRQNKVYSEASWRDASAKIITKTMRLSAADPFCEPVGLEDAPDYTSIIQNPMDLSTLRKRLPQLSSPMDVIAGVNLIVDNCVMYNGETSEYSSLAIDMQRGFMKYWAGEGMPMSEDQWRSMLECSARQPAAAPVSILAPSAGGGGGGGHRGRSKGGYNNSLAALSPAPGAFPAHDWLDRASRAVVQLSRLEVGQPFKDPVPRDLLNYYEVISKPMDIATISKKLVEERYRDPSEVAADVAQMWANCRIFNEPDSDLVACAMEAEQAFIKLWQAKGVYQGGIPAAAGMVRAPTQGDWRDAARTVLYRIINRERNAAWFVDPVSTDDVPDYYEVIKHPMDLGTALENLKRGVYASPAQLLADVERVWANAEQYNGPDHEVTIAAKKAQAAFMTQWLKMGLGAVTATTLAQQLAASMQQQQPLVVAPPPPPAAAPKPASNSGDWVSGARSIVTSIMNHPDAVFLRLAAEQQQQQSPDEPSFGNILKNLGRDRYANSEQVLADLKTILDKYKAIDNAQAQVVEAAASEAWRSAGLS